MIDLRRTRDVGELLTITLQTFGRRWHVFLAMTFVVVAPVVVLVDGVLGRALADGADADPQSVGYYVSSVAATIGIAALVTGLHCVVVAALAEGRLLGVGAAFAEVGPRSLAAFATVALYLVLLGLGFIALVIPGIWLSVRCYFGAQTVVLEGRGPVRALRRSADLVDGSWWRVAGLLVLTEFLFGQFVVPLQAIGILADDGIVWTTTLVLVKTVTVSLGTIFGTFLFFDLRARHDALVPGEPWAARDFREIEWLPPQPPQPPPGA